MGGRDGGMQGRMDSWRRGREVGVESLRGGDRFGGRGGGDSGLARMTQLQKFTCQSLRAQLSPTVAEKKTNT